LERERSSLRADAGVRFHLPWNASLPHGRRLTHFLDPLSILTSEQQGARVPIPSLPPTWPTDPNADPLWLATADPETLRAAVVRLSARVAALEWERAALVFAAESFGALADRLNHSLRAIRETPPC
jgi:hypothetical protein